MPGSWEYRPPSVIVGILTRSIVPTAWAQKWRELKLPSDARPLFLSGMPFDHARNVAAQKTLELGYTWLFFLDDDVLPPADAYDRLMKHGLDIVSGLYYRRHDPVEPLILRNGPKKPYYVRDFRPGELIECDLVGTGCLLIHRRVLERIKQPWFEWLMDRNDIPENERVSEDYAFCRKAKNAGFRIHVDTAVQCEHAGYGKAELGGKFTPLSI